MIFTSKSGQWQAKKLKIKISGKLTLYCMNYKNLSQECFYSPLDMKIFYV